MSLQKVVVPFYHDSADLSNIYIAVISHADQRSPKESEWKPAYRDVVNGQRVVWAKFDLDNSFYMVWVRHKNQDRVAVESMRW